MPDNNYVTHKAKEQGTPYLHLAQPRPLYLYANATRETPKVQATPQKEEKRH